MSTPTLVAACVVGALALLWLVAMLKTSRPDGRLARVHPYRRMMPIIMRKRNESIVFFDHDVDATNLLAWLDEVRGELGCNFSHLLVAAVARGLHLNPNMNRFVVGQRIYDRDGVWLSFSMKRKKLDRKSKIATVKLPVPAEMSFGGFCEAVNDKIGVERSDEETYLDRELGLFFRLPHFIIVRAQGLLVWLDDHNLLPGSFIENDALYTSAFVANLGSLGMDPGYHHLYEWGNCPLFVMAGKVTDMPVVVDGEVVIRPMLRLRFSYDERVDDGLSARHGLDDMLAVLEDPAAHLGARGEVALGEDA